MDPKAAPEAVWDLVARTELIADETMEDRKAGIRGALVEIVKKDGAVLSEKVTVPRGDPENPVTEEEILTKLRICAAGLAEMYRDYIDGKKEIRDINMEFCARHETEDEDPDEDIHDPCLRFQR